MMKQIYKLQTGQIRVSGIDPKVTVLALLQESQIRKKSYCRLFYSLSLFFINQLQ